MEIKFTQEEIDQCNDFANKIDTSYYATRSQTDNNKRRHDQVIGKLGEIAVFNSLKEKHPSLGPPDFRIFSKKEKSWDFDLKGDGISLHVKSQDIKQSKKYGESWIFQKGNGVNRNYDKEIFDRLSPNQYVSFVVVNLNENCATIKAIVDLDFLHKKELFKEPVLEKLRFANKMAVYFRDMKEYSTKLWAL